MPWEAAFDDAVLGVLQRNPDDVAAWDRRDFKEWQQLAGRGQLGAGDPARRALWAAFRYQRYHIDAMASLLETWRATNERVVLDVGCGAGGVAVALWERLAALDAPGDRVAYVGVDHNPHALSLAENLLGHASWDPPRPYELHLDIPSAVQTVTRHIAAGRQLLVTLSYFLRQWGVDAGVARSVADTVCDLTEAAGATEGRPTHLLITDATAGTSRFSDLYDALTARVHVKGSRVPNTIRMPQRWPNLHPDTEGRFVTRNPYDPTVERLRFDLYV
jgi:SAM-dependent methyltransferase